MKQLVTWGCSGECATLAQESGSSTILSNLGGDSDGSGSGGSD